LPGGRLTIQVLHGFEERFILLMAALATIQVIFDQGQGRLGRFTGQLHLDEAVQFLETFITAYFIGTSHLDRPDHIPQYIFRQFHMLSILFLKFYA